MIGRLTCVSDAWTWVCRTLGLTKAPPPIVAPTSVQAAAEHYQRLRQEYMAAMLNPPILFEQGALDPSMMTTWDAHRPSAIIPYSSHHRPPERVRPSLPSLEVAQRQRHTDYYQQQQWREIQEFGEYSPNERTSQEAINRLQDMMNESIMASPPSAPANRSVPGGSLASLLGGFGALAGSAAAAGVVNTERSSSAVIAGDYAAFLARRMPLSMRMPEPPPAPKPAEAVEHARQIHVRDT